MRTIFITVSLSLSILLCGNAFSQVNTSAITTQFFKCIRSGDLDSVKLLIEKGAFVNTHNHLNETPLIIATQNGQAEIVKYLLECGAYPDYAKVGGLTPLMMACFAGDFNCAHHIARYSKFIDKKDYYGTRALHYAVYSGDFDIVNMLLEYGAQPNAVSKEMNRPIHIACYILDTTVALTLIEHGANVEVVNNEGATPIIIAAEQKNFGVFKVLQRKGANINVKNKEGYSPLGIAVLNDDMPLVDHLLGKEKVDLFKPKDDANPINLARRNFIHRDLIKFRNLGYHGYVKPRFSITSFSMEVSMNRDDVFYFPAISAYEPNYNIQLLAGVNSRFGVKSVTVFQENSKKVIDESVLFLDIGFRKYIPLRASKSNKVKIGVYAGYSLQTYFKYRKNDRNFFNRPNAGFYIRTSDVVIGIGYAYTNYRYPYISPHKITFNIFGPLRTFDEEMEIHPYVPTWF